MVSPSPAIACLCGRPTSCIGGSIKLCPSQCVFAARQRRRDSRSTLVEDLFALLPSILLLGRSGRRESRDTPDGRAPPGRREVRFSEQVKQVTYRYNSQAFSFSPASSAPLAFWASSWAFGMKNCAYLSQSYGSFMSCCTPSARVVDGYGASHATYLDHLLEDRLEVLGGAEHKRIHSQAQLERWSVTTMANNSGRTGNAHFDFHKSLKEL